MKRSELKEIIREMVLTEIEFKSQEDFDEYKAKHKMRASTKVNISGKETTVGQASKTDKPKSGGGVDWDATIKKYKGKRRVPSAITKKYVSDNLKKSGLSDDQIDKYNKASLSGTGKELSKKDQAGYKKFQRLTNKFQKDLYAKLKK